MYRKNEENFLLKHTAAVHINNDLTSVDRKLYNVLIKKAFNNLLKQDMHSLSIESLLKDLGHENYKNHSFIKDSIQKLVNSSIKFNILGKDKRKKWESAISLLSSAHFSSGIVYYTFPKELSLNFARPSIYANLNLEYQNKLSSKYSVSLWEFCTEQLDSNNSSKLQTNIIPLEKIRELLGAQDQTYDEFKNLNRVVFKKSINEINSLTDIFVLYELVKSEKKVIGITFTIERKNNIEYLSENVDIISVISNSIDEQEINNNALILGIEQSTIDEFLKHHSSYKVNEVIKIIIKKIKSNENINDIISYIWKALEKGIYQKISSKNINKPIVQVDEKKIFGDNQLLREFFLKCKNYFGDGIYKSWILHLSYFSHNDENVVFNINSAFIKKTIEEKYSKKLLEIWKEICPSAKNFIIQNTIQ
jgi:plasmid replication initiation protein